MSVLLPLLVGMVVAQSARLVSYNVARFTSDSGHSIFEPIKSALVSLAPTVVCLNEVDILKLESRGESLSQLAEALGGYHFAFFGHVQGRYGNALLSRYPIVTRREVVLNGGTIVKHGAGSHCIKRGLLVAEITGLDLTVACTHLDHISEHEREVQLSHVVEVLSQCSADSGGGGRGKLVLMGDLNALTRSDYNETHWSSLIHHNRVNGWGSPEYGCLGQLEKANFRDSWTLKKPSSEVDEHRWTTHKEGIGDRRIDYIWLDQSALPQISVRGSWVARGIAHSDHFPLIVDVEMSSLRVRHEASL